MLLLNLCGNTLPTSKVFPHLNLKNYLCIKRYIMIDLKNLKGFVFYVDMLGFTALTQDKIQLTKDVEKDFRD